MMSQAVNQFDWVEFYKEFAEKLLAYKDNRQELNYQGETDFYGYRH